MTFQDIFKSSFLDNVNSVSLLDMALALVLAFGIGLFIFLVYKKTFSGVMYSSSFGVTLVAITMITAMVILAVTSNVVLSLGMVGALSIVRFRTAIKDPRDSTYIFWCIAVGISCGVSYYALAAIGTGIIFLTMLVMGTIKANDRYLLIIRGAPASSSQIEEAVLLQYEGKALLRVRNEGTEDVEYIYELSQRILEEGKRKSMDIHEALFLLEGVNHLDLVCQNEEMSR